ncbi:uridine kinase [Pelagicoccus enzymogenes]|uniref:uridine kinase n=1 Tax=Pelagicoccus enzymogenes TaxID=2773457 RepID=UPI00280C7434|nr:uridine kinase [Pelagicoccus enzymogenes]MDQ8197507.1 uridine kinase [Pelagicoccus enzymogenes]
MRAPTLIGITGGSGSGKSWLARHLQNELGPRQIASLQQDWYYRDLSHLPAEEAAKTDFDDPAALELDLLETHLRELAAGRSIQAPQYDFATFSRSPQTLAIEPASIIAVEGLFVLHPPSLCKLLDISVYVETPSDIRLLRRIRRDLSERGYKLERILDFWEHDQFPSFTKFVQPQRARASQIWDSLQDTALVPALLADLRNRTTRYADQPTT